MCVLATVFVCVYIHAYVYVCVCACVHVCSEVNTNLIQINISQTVTGDDTDSVVPPDSDPLDQSGE